MAATDTAQFSPPSSAVAAQLVEENGDEATKDCHGVVKASTGLGGFKRSNLCGQHANRMARRNKVNVACQTDDSDLYTSHVGLANCSKAAISAESSPRKEDASKPEGTLRLMIQNFRNMTDTVRGPGKSINGVPWKIMVMPRQHVVQKKGTQKCLGFFLQCCPDAYSDLWSCQAAAELRLISQKSGVPNFTRKTSHVYTAKENDWGYSCFMTWADILDESQGYIKDDKVILEVYVKADAPKNVLTHDQFEKKIQDYMRLADMQSSRGLIDKAIEVNQSALKFCKDKDENCKLELEAQKARLIEMKLKQSIERIEKGKDPTKEGEDDPTGASSLNALKQALTASTGTTPSANAGGGAGAAQPAAPVANTNTAPTKKNNNNGNAAVKSSPQKKISPTLSEEQKADDEKAGEQLPALPDDDCWGDSSLEDGDDGDELGQESEICDSCLQERLDTMENRADVQMLDSGCQTEAPTKTQMTSPTAAAFAAAAVKGAAQRLPAAVVGNPLTAENVAAFAANAGGKWTPEKEAELLDLITHESRASLDSIRDTLERLVHLAQDGDVPPGLDVDLQQLKSLRAEHLKQRSLEPPMDVIELPAAIDCGQMGAAGDGQPIQSPQNTVIRSAPAGGEQEKAKAIAKPRPKQVDVAAKSKSIQPLVDAVEAAEKAGDLAAAREAEALLNAAVGEYTDDECALIRHAKQIVESKAEELVSKYSQLIEQSEATRLAETVKKVEKRMKDIEKQTMTCRKELADECDRHYKEEQKLIKANKQLQAQIGQAADRADKLGTQLKERKAEIKKLEKRLKTETQTSAENAEMTDRIEILEKEVGQLQKKLSDEQKRHQRESQSLIDSKKHLAAELSSAEADVHRLNTQLDDKNQQLRKADNRQEQERKQTTTALKEAVERAKKAEVNLLEFKLEIGIKLLTRAQEDCQTNIKQLDDMAKRDALRKYMSEWQKTKEEIGRLITSSKTEFNTQVEAVRAGKALAQLPLIHVAKPPPPPKAALTAAAAAAAVGGSVTTLESTTLPSSPMTSSSIVPPSTPPQPPAPIGARPQAVQSLPPVNTSSSLSMGLVNGSILAPVAEAIATRVRTPPPSSAPIQSSTSSTPSQIQMQQNIAPATAPVTTSSSSGGSGMSPWLWSDQLNIAETLMASHRSFGPLGSNFGTGDLHSSTSTSSNLTSMMQSGSHHQSNGWSDTWSGAGGGLPNHVSAVLGNSSSNNSTNVTSQPPPSQSSYNPGQWGVGWGYQQVTAAPPSASPPVADKIVIDSRGSSPISVHNERNKRVDTLMDQLRATFPNISHDVLAEYVNEYRNQRPGKTLKGMSVETALNGVVSLIMNKQAGWNKPVPLGPHTAPPPILGSGGPPLGALDSFQMAAAAVANETCVICRNSMVSTPSLALKCRHRFHTKCVKDWLSKQQTCPSCGKFSPSPEEYPELA